jgi:hypothetical protein
MASVFLDGGWRAVAGGDVTMILQLGEGKEHVRHDPNKMGERCGAQRCISP